MEKNTELRIDDLEWYKQNPYIQTYTGRKFHFLNPTLEEIDIRDIAHALSNMCRFGGHVKKFYSVAEHSLYVSDKCSDENKLWGLLHDATEAYLVDIPKPIKGFLTNYVEMENTLMKAIAQKFGLKGEMPVEVKDVDARMLFTEKEQVLHYVDWRWQLEPYFDLEIECRTPFSAEQLFLNKFTSLTQ